jgi:hypothetical protein
MKKLVIATFITLAAASASAANFVSVDIETVKDSVTNAKSTAQYVRVGKELAGLQLGLQSRTSRADAGGSMFNSLEVTAGKPVGQFTPFVGVGYDNGLNGAKNGQYEYGLVGVTAGRAIGPGYLFGGVKTRVNWDSANPKQTVAFGTYSVPVAKNVSVNFNTSRSYQDIKESAYGLGLTIGF